MKSLEVYNSSKMFSKNKSISYSKCVVELLTFSTFIFVFIYLFSVVDHSTKIISKSNNTTEINIPTSQSFPEQMRAFPWQHYRNAVNRNDTSVIQHYTELLLTSILIPFTIKEPPVPVNLSCHPPTIQEPEKIGPCVRRQHPRKVGVILSFGFDVDALELHLHELYDVVDKFFLIEGTKMHNQYLNSKPSIWDMVKYTPRFSKFHHKIIHLIVDDADYSVTETKESSVPDVYKREYLEEKIRLQKFLKWNSASGYFGPQDIIGVGATDEIPNRNVINFLKSCELHHEIIRLGIWFPFPYINTIFASDYPIGGYPFTLNTPVYSTLTSLTNLLTKTGNMSTESDDGSILGGLHFSKYPYLPFQCIKTLTQNAELWEGPKSIIEIGFLYKSTQHEDDGVLEEFITKKWLDKWNGLKHRIKSVDWFRKMYGDVEANAIVKLPWFYQCNPERFSSFHRKRDHRLA